MSAYFTQSLDQNQKFRPVAIKICQKAEFATFIKTLSPAEQAFINAQNFTASTGQCVIVPNFENNQNEQNVGQTNLVLFGAGPEPTPDTEGNPDQTHGYANCELLIGTLVATLTAKHNDDDQAPIYQITSIPKNWSWPLVAVSWGMGAYKFDRYRSKPHKPACLYLEDKMNPEESIAIVQGLHLGRDLINTPATDMAPQNLHDQAIELAARFGAKISAVIGEDLIEQNYPMIHAVGRAAHQPPRLVEIHWNPTDDEQADQDLPLLCLVGKGITFDTGGLNMKGSAGMRLMKKDMGGSAHVFALAHMIMANKLPLRLHALLAIADNAVAANSFRPGDILSSRKGLTVEIDNTDAEGRLVLGDALTKASEAAPDLILDFATLTGAARVALGPTLPPFFTNQPHLTDSVMKQAAAQNDPIWPMPLWTPYLSLLSSPIADLKNSGSGFAGCMTAALFLEKFIGTAKGQEKGSNLADKTPPWMHLDVYGWNPTATPAKPAGGEIMSVRGLYHWLKDDGLALVKTS